MINKFENHIADTFGCSFAISTGSGTIALYIVLEALQRYHRIDPAKNITIQVPSFTWDSTYLAIKMAGMTPTFADIEKDTYHIRDDPKLITDFKILMDTFGSVCPPSKNSAFNDTIVDASHSFGAPDDKLRGIAHIYSLNGGKIFTVGEGGLILTDDEEYMKICVALREQVSRISTMTAAVGLTSLDVLDDNISKRYENYLYYLENISSDYKPQIIPISTNYYMFACTHQMANRIIINLRDVHGIDCRQYYYPLSGSIPIETKINNAYWIGSRLLCLPTGYDIDVEYIVEKMNREAEKERSIYRDYWIGQNCNNLADYNENLVTL